MRRGILQDRGIRVLSKRRFMHAENEMMKVLEATAIEPELATERRSHELLNVEEIAARLRLPKSWVYSHANGLGVIRAGKYLRFDWGTVLARLRGSEGQSQANARARTTGALPTLHGPVVGGTR